MNKPTMQELFNAAFLGVWNQGCQSLDSEGACMYRGKNGAKCAIGHIIPDDLYVPRMERCALYPLTQVPIAREAFEAVADKLQLSQKSLEMLTEMQCNHDYCAHRLDGKPFDTPEEFRLEWESRCARTATKFGLKMPDLPGHEPCDTQASS